MSLLLQFIFAFFASLGFAFIFNMPARRIFAAALTGALGWSSFLGIQLTGQPAIVACFLAACLVAACGELFARLFKEASIIYIIPGILPLVPGAGMYKTMLSLLQEDLAHTAQVGTETLMMTGAIALSILLVSSFVRALTKIIT